MVQSEKDFPENRHTDCVRRLYWEVPGWYLKQGNIRVN